MRAVVSLYRKSDNLRDHRSSIEEVKELRTPAITIFSIEHFQEAGNRTKHQLTGDIYDGVFIGENTHVPIHVYDLNKDRIVLSHGCSS
jgi:hypothetical protein